MAALNIAFDAPDNAFGACPSKGRPIDLVHLATQTMGDKSLELEVLQMFARQARQSMKDLANDNADSRKSAAHRLKGAALAVGAFTVSGASEALEENLDDSARLAAVAAAVIEAENFILKLSR